MGYLGASWAIAWAILEHTGPSHGLSWSLLGHPATHPPAPFGECPGTPQATTTTTTRHTDNTCFKPPRCDGEVSHMEKRATPMWLWQVAVPHGKISEAHMTSKRINILHGSSAALSKSHIHTEERALCGLIMLLSSQNYYRAAALPKATIVLRSSGCVTWRHHYPRCHRRHRRHQHDPRCQQAHRCLHAHILALRG